MSSSFRTLEEGMRIILCLLFLQEPFAFPTSCSLQLHGRWALGAGRVEDPKPHSERSRGNQPLLGRRVSRPKGARGRELPQTPSSQSPLANL